jgi:hypothetical protein
LVYHFFQKLPFGIPLFSKVAIWYTTFFKSCHLVYFRLPFSILTPSKPFILELQKNTTKQHPPPKTKNSQKKRPSDTQSPRLIKFCNRSPCSAWLIHLKIFLRPFLICSHSSQKGKVTPKLGFAEKF